MGIERLRHYGGMAYYGDNRNNLKNPASTCMESVNKISSDPLRNVADGAGRDEMGGLHPVNMHEDGSPRIGVRSVSYGAVPDQDQETIPIEPDMQHLHGVNERKVLIKTSGWFPNMKKRRNRQIAFRVTLGVFCIVVLGSLCYYFGPSHKSYFKQPASVAPRTSSPIMPATSDGAMDLPTETYHPDVTTDTQEASADESAVEEPAAAEEDVKADDEQPAEAVDQADPNVIDHDESRRLAEENAANDAADAEAAMTDSGNDEVLGNDDELDAAFVQTHEDVAFIQSLLI